MTQLYDGATGHTAPKLETILITREIYPISLLDDLRKVYRTVLYYPLPFIPDPSDPSIHLPSAHELASADVMLFMTVPPNLHDIKQMPKAKFFQSLMAGYTHITDHPFFKSIPESSTVQFASASGIHVSTIGEHCIAVALSLFHKIGVLQVKGHVEQHWVPAKELYGQNYIRNLKGQTVGIIGYGHIGREAARLAAAFGSTITTLTRSGKRAKIGGFLVEGTGDPTGALPTTWFSSDDVTSREAFFSGADVVINTLPSSAATQKFVGKKELKAMKGDALLINIGRGDTVDTEKLLQALTANPKQGEEENASGTLRIGGAGLDVTDPEPLPDGHPFFRLENVVLTPHSSALSSDYFVLAVDLLLANTERVKEGKGVLNAYRGRGEDDE